MFNLLPNMSLFTGKCEEGQCLDMVVIVIKPYCEKEDMVERKIHIAGLGYSSPLRLLFRYSLTFA